MQFQNIPVVPNPSNVAKRIRSCQNLFKAIDSYHFHGQAEATRQPTDTITRRATVTMSVMAGRVRRLLSQSGRVTRCLMTNGRGY
jgi:16S rRNA G527 N7-methylase RsmG